MLYWLFYQVLHRYIPAFRVFGYVTTRVALASLTALFLSLAAGSLVDPQASRARASGSISAKTARNPTEKKRERPPWAVADHRVNRDPDAALGGFAKPLRLDSDCRSARIRSHWILRRLCKGCPKKAIWA